MATKVQGRNFTVDGREARIFDRSGRNLGGGEWEMYLHLDMPVKRRRDVQEIESIRYMIFDVERRGFWRKINGLFVDPRAALTLFLEGILTPQHLQRASEGNVWICITNFVFDGRTVALTIENGLGKRIGGFADLVDRNGRSLTDPRYSPY